ncbi:MAG TPA: hypothetical protein VFS08_01950 [Gemmatimonadaceae bacterium]|nr:hypothetical protein [Gemmatimonadaceae bacterium]
MARKSASASAYDTAAPPRRDRVATVLKWVGGATAVLSLLFALQRAGQMIGEARERRRAVAELLAAARTYEASGNYDAGWRALEQAAERDPDDDRVRAARETLGMRWLDDIRVREGERTFSEIVALVQPVLVRGATRAEGQRRADLLAHVGWAEFLRWRDGERELRPDSLYRQALTVDPGNVYAHAMLAHWLAWSGRDLPAVRRHLDSALAAGRERGYVRRIQFAAMRNLGGAAGDSGLVLMAAELRRGTEAPGEGWAGEFVRAYERRWRRYCRGDSAGRPSAGGAALALADGAPTEHAATLGWLASQPGGDSDGVAAAFYRACLLEAAGQGDSALAAYRALRPTLPSLSSYASDVDAALARLSPRSTPP